MKKRVKRQKRNQSKSHANYLMRKHSFVMERARRKGDFHNAKTQRQGYMAVRRRSLLPVILLFLMYFFIPPYWMDNRTQSRTVISSPGVITKCLGFNRLGRSIHVTWVRCNKMQLGRSRMCVPWFHPGFSLGAEANVILGRLISANRKPSKVANPGVLGAGVGDKKTPCPRFASRH